MGHLLWKFKLSQAGKKCVCQQAGRDLQVVSCRTPVIEYTCIFMVNAAVFCCHVCTAVTVDRYDEKTFSLCALAVTEHHLLPARKGLFKLSFSVFIVQNIYML